MCLELFRVWFGVVLGIVDYISAENETLAEAKELIGTIGRHSFNFLNNIQNVSFLVHASKAVDR